MININDRLKMLALIFIGVTLYGCTQENDQKSSEGLPAVVNPAREESPGVFSGPEPAKPIKDVKAPPVTLPKPEVANKAVEVQSSLPLTSKPIPMANKSTMPPCPMSGPKNNCIGTYIHASNGIEYVGEYQNDKWNGQGMVTYASGSKYIGEWRDSIINGYGVMTFASGVKYDGNWKNGKMDGKGTMTFLNGIKFIGEYKENKQHGQGVLSRADGSIVQQGVWESGKFIDSQ